MSSIVSRLYKLYYKNYVTKRQEWWNVQQGDQYVKSGLPAEDDLHGIEENYELDV